MSHTIHIHYSTPRISQWWYSHILTVIPTLSFTLINNHFIFSFRSKNMSQNNYYESDKSLIEQYLINELHYDLEKIFKGKAKRIEVDLDKMMQKDFTNLVNRIKANSRSYCELFSLVIDKLFANLKKSKPVDKLDVFLTQEKIFDSKIDSSSKTKRKIPLELMRRYQVCFKSESIENLELRNLRSSHIGKLVRIRGQVISISQVKPMIKVAVYTCPNCSSVIYQEIQSLEYKPAYLCISEECRINFVSRKTEVNLKKSEENQRQSNLTNLILQTQFSKFIEIQTIVLQEISSGIMGIPKQIKVVAKETFVNKCEVGDHVNITGLYLPIKRPREILCDAYFEPHQIHLIEKYREK